jgi:hypothetical protein
VVKNKGASRYKEADADKLYSNALKSGRKTNSLGTVWYLAEAAGVRLEDLRALDVRLRQVSVPEREYPCGNLPLPSLDDAPAAYGTPYGVPIAAYGASQTGFPLGTSPNAPTGTLGTPQDPSSPPSERLRTPPPPPGTFRTFKVKGTFKLSPFPPFPHTHTGARTLYIDNKGNERGGGKEGGYGPEGGSGRGFGRGPEGFSRRGPEGGTGRGRGPEGGPRSGLGGETETADEEDWTEKEEDGVISTFLFIPTDADYEAVMALAEPLYHHIIHALRLMPDEEVRYRPLTKQQQWLQCLPHEFTRKEALEAAASLKIGTSTCDTYLRRLTERGTLRRVSEGKYRLADAAEPPKDE